MSDPLFMLGRSSDTSFRISSGDVLRTADDVQNAYAQRQAARWVIVQATALSADALKRLAAVAQVHVAKHRVLLLESVTAPRGELLRALFKVVIAPDSVALLPKSELQEVLSDERAEDLFIGGVADHEGKALVLYRGNLHRLVVPFSWFKSQRKGPLPDFERFSVVDFGQTISLGDYEAAGDAILYEFDLNSRRRMRDRSLGEDSSFGGSLRRLRLQRGLERTDFAPLSSKTIARIERGDVNKPQDDTLNVIAKRLGVNPEDIDSY